MEKASSLEKFEFEFADSRIGHQRALEKMRDLVSEESLIPRELKDRLRSWLAEFEKWSQGTMRALAATSSDNHRAHDTLRVQGYWIYGIFFYLGQECQKFEAARRSEAHSILKQNFTDRGIDYDREIFPHLWAHFYHFVLVWAMSRTAKEIDRAYQKNRKRYDRAARLLTEQAAPYSGPLKADIKQRQAQLGALQVKQQFSEPGCLTFYKMKGSFGFALRGKGIGKEFGFNLEKAPSKQPLWQNCQLRLFQILKERGITDRQAYMLIAQLLLLFIPHWFDPRHPEDTIRLNVSRLLKKTSKD
ncbi:MAG: hypothetical protein AB7P69_20320 [Candidatus Binatia bacterium]